MIPPPTQIIAAMPITDKAVMILGMAWTSIRPIAREPASRRLLLSQPRAQPTCFAPGDVDGGRVRKVGSANRRDWFLVTHAGLDARCFSQGLDTSE